MEQKFIVTKSQLNRLVRKSQNNIKTVIDRINQDKLRVFDAQLEEIEEQKQKILKNKQAGNVVCSIKLFEFPTTTHLTITALIGYDNLGVPYMTNELCKTLYESLGKVGQVKGDTLYIPSEVLLDDWKELARGIGFSLKTKNNAGVEAMGQKFNDTVSKIKKLLK